MSERYDEDPAFPLPAGAAMEGRSGMTLRDYFAAKAMPMIRGFLSPEFIAARAYEMADAMLKERAK